MTTKYNERYEAKINEKLGVLLVEMTLRYPRHRFRAGHSGFFSNKRSTFEEGVQETIVSINLFDGMANMWVLPNDTPKNISIFNDKNKATKILQKVESFSIFDIGSFEVTDAHQYMGMERIDIKGIAESTRHMTVEKEDPLWDIATVDTRFGNRPVIMRSHCHKDFAFKINSRTNMIFEYYRDLLLPFEDEIRDNARQNYAHAHEAPAENQGAKKELFDQIASRFRDERPDWPWFTDTIIDLENIQRAEQAAQQAEAEKAEIQAAALKEAERKIVAKREAAAHQRKEMIDTTLKTGKTTAVKLGKFAKFMGEKLTEGQKKMAEEAKKRDDVPPSD